MKKGLLCSALFALLLGATTGCSQEKPKAGSTDIVPTKEASHEPDQDGITPDLLRLSELVKMDYRATLAKFRKGDEHAIADFLDFFRIVEQKSATDHALVVLSAIPDAGDGQVANVVKTQKDKLKILVRDQLVAAQPKASKPEQRASMETWAPRTWAALNNQILRDPAREAAKEAEKKDKANQKPSETIVKPTDMNSGN